MNRSDTLESWATWLAALVFFSAGGAKLAGLAVMQLMFDDWGLPVWFMYFTGLVEVGGAAALLAKGTVVGFAGAVLLAATMVVGTGIHLTHDPFYQALPALALTALLAWLALRQRATATPWLRSLRLG